MTSQRVVVGLVVIMACATGLTSAEDGFSLRLHTQLIVADRTLHVLDPAVLELTSKRDFGLSVWDSPMARLHLESAILQGELGHIGEVHGGRYNQFNVTLDALGVVPSGGVEAGRLFDREYWNEMSRSEQVSTGIQIAVTAGILAYIIDGLT